MMDSRRYTANNALRKNLEKDDPEDNGEDDLPYDEVFTASFDDKTSRLNL